MLKKTRVVIFGEESVDGAGEEKEKENFTFPTPFHKVRDDTFTLTKGDSGGENCRNYFNDNCSL